MDAATIALATGLPARRIRYVLEQRVLPGTEKASRGNRVTRDFTAFEGFGIAVTAMMLECGIGRRTTAEVLRALTKSRPSRDGRSSAGLLALFQSSSAAAIEIIDGQRLRWSTSPSSKTSWHVGALGTMGSTRKSAQASPDVEPIVIVRVNAHHLRAAIKRAERKV